MNSEADPAEQILIERFHLRVRAGVQRQREHHHLHHRDAGDADPLQLRALFGARRGIVFVRHREQRRIAAVFDAAEQLCNADARSVVVDRDVMRRRVRPHARYAVQRAQRRFDARGTTRTTHVGNFEIDLCPSVVERPGDEFCRRGIVGEAELTQRAVCGDGSHGAGCSRQLVFDSGWVVTVNSSSAP